MPNNNNEIQNDMSNESNKDLNNNHLFEYIRAVFIGAGSVVIDYANMIAHPLDNVIYPISNLVFDAAIVAAGHEYNSNPHQPLNGDFVLLQKIVAHHPQIYNDAVKRMLARGDKLKRLSQQFVNGSGPQRVEMTVHTFGHILAPGFIIKGIKAVSNLNIATRLNPPRFADTYQHVPTLPEIPHYSIADIRNRVGSEKLLYVITEDRKLLITPEFQDVGQSGFRYVTRVFHMELGRRGKVIAAGEGDLNNGIILQLNNNAGRYKPQGQHLPRLVEDAFIREGYTEARGKFVDFHSEFLEQINSIERFPSQFSTISFPVIQGLRAISNDNQGHRQHIQNNIDAETHYRRGCELWLNQNNLSAAISEFNEVIKLNTNHADAYVARGYCQGQLGNYKQAISDATQALSVKEDLHDFDLTGVYVHSASYYKALGEYQKALESASKSLELKPDYNLGYKLRAEAHHHLKQYHQALQDVNQYLGTDPTDSDMLTLRQQIQTTINAESHYRRGCELWLNQNNLSAAISEFNKVIKLNTNHADAYVARGYCQGQLGNYKQAIRDATQALSVKEDLHDFDLPGVYVHSASYYKALGEYQKALESASKSLELKPGYNLGYKLRAEAHHHLKQYHQALQNINHYLGTDPKDSDMLALRQQIQNTINAESHYRRGYELWLKQKLYNHAIAKFNKALQLNSEHADAYVARGYCHGKLENYKQAISDAAQALRFKQNLHDFNLPRVHTHLASYRRTLAQINKAKQKENEKRQKAKEEIEKKRAKKIARREEKEADDFLYDYHTTPSYHEGKYYLKKTLQYDCGPRLYCEWLIDEGFDKKYIRRRFKELIEIGYVDENNVIKAGILLHKDQKQRCNFVQPGESGLERAAKDAASALKKQSSVNIAPKSAFYKSPSKSTITVKQLPPLAGVKKSNQFFINDKSSSKGEKSCPAGSILLPDYPHHGDEKKCFKIIAKVN